MRHLAATILGLALASPMLGQDARDDDPPQAKSDRELAEAARDAWDYLLKKYDSNKDGQVQRKEYDRSAEHWLRLDTDGDGVLTQKDLASRGRRRPVPKTLAPPRVGERAPDFELEVLPPKPKEGDGERPAEERQPLKKPELVKLSAFKGKRPVALIFGSYT
jgi:hypothetical protein